MSPKHSHFASRVAKIMLLVVGCGASLTVALPTVSSPQSSRQHPGAKPANPIFLGISPDVIVGGLSSATVRLRGKGLEVLTSVDILDCDEKHTRLPVDNPRPAAFTVTIPASLLVKPCVLRVSGMEGIFFNVPLGVADPELAKLKPPAYSSSQEELDWGGWFNHLLVSGDIDISSKGEAVSVRVDSGSDYVFILGKHETPLFRVNPLKRPVPDGAMRGATRFDLFLPGVDVTDVQWGGDDEGFWIGTLAKNHTEVEDRRLLSSMADEPSGPIDRNY